MSSAVGCKVGCLAKGFVALDTPGQNNNINTVHVMHNKYASEGVVDRPGVASIVFDEEGKIIFAFQKLGD